MLKFVIDKLDDVSESDRQHYVAENGKYYLATQGEHPRVAEFRAKNVDLLKTVAQFDGINVEAVKADRLKVTALEAQLATLEKTPSRVTDLEAQLAAAQQKANKSEVRNTLRSKAIAAGVLPAAVEILLDKSELVFEATPTGAVQAKADKFSPNRPGELVTPDEWVASAIHEFPFLFSPSTGAGAEGRRAGGASGDAKMILRNPSPQQLGEHSKAIAEGKLKIEYTT